ncbi:MAG: hypothetical protein HYZ17_14140 [Betaproteobacteria bacterium]|nr:hypothetical protein [Betaproteobacteria bacterium]
MRTSSKCLTTLVLALGLAASGIAAEHAGHGHEHGAAPTRLELKAGKKWPTDATLRQAMNAIRANMQAALPGIHEHQFSAQQYGALATKLGAEVVAIVANCKLDPEADAQLHLVISDLLEGIEAMEGKSRTAQREAGAVTVVTALEKYGKYFEHSGWQALAH